MSATTPKRQTLPRWHLAREDDAAEMPKPPRSATIIPFPGAAARRAPVVTYRARIVLPARPVADPAPRTSPRDRRISVATAVGLTLAGLLLMAI